MSCKEDRKEIVMLVIEDKKSEYYEEEGWMNIKERRGPYYGREMTEEHEYDEEYEYEKYESEEETDMMGKKEYYLRDIPMKEEDKNIMEDENQIYNWFRESDDEGVSEGEETDNNKKPEDVEGIFGGIMRNVKPRIMGYEKDDDVAWNEYFQCEDL
jgi:hypothetical protein